MCKFQGTVKKVCELQKFSSGFEKQDFVIEGDKGGNWSIVAVGLLAAAVVVGCVQNEVREAPMVEEFVIPRPLVTRMLDAHDRARDKHLAMDIKFDSSELWSLLLGEFKMTNANEIVRRPRGNMKFCDDLMTDDQRQSWWPFAFEKFESELESKLELSEEYGFRIKPEFAESIGGGMNDDGHVAPNPTSRWVNGKIEEWAIQALDENKKRLEDVQLCKLFGVEKIPEGTIAWMVNEEIVFIIQQRDGAWNLRDYMFVFCRDGESTGLVFSFDSFPSRKAATAILQFQTSAVACNNVAVMMWDHQCDHFQMNPGIIKLFLEEAVLGGEPTAAANLEVLRAHIPEVFMSESESFDDRE